MLITMLITMLIIETLAEEMQNKWVEKNDVLNVGVRRLR